jgi:hypothetical protein
VICIDCRVDRPITVVQTRVIARRIQHWHVCRVCLANYERETAVIQAELAAARAAAAGPAAKRSAQGRLV